jgi:uncharacterized protein
MRILNIGGIKMANNDERLLAAVMYGISIPVPILGPIVIWLLKKNESQFINYHGKEYFNFLISYSVYTFISGILTIVLIGFLMLWILGILAFVFTIIAAIRAYEGKEYRIPLVFRLIQ